MNELLETAKTIGDPEQEKETKSQTPANNVPFDPEAPPEVDNGGASFERFMTSFGSPRRWAGR